ncbi:MAG: hypothetical protein SFY66_05495 [Oculatellaceae cyanobacterium bins.114]|nr:hypothetical protein [Oculatellaceae cyanobacterium bins.114]
MSKKSLNQFQRIVRGQWRSLAVAFISTLLLVTLGLTHATTAQTASFTIGLWGDMPYARNNDGPKMEALVRDMNAANLAFSVYDGDIKDGSSLCTDNMFTSAIAMFNLSTSPVVYVPGDNEWTDCHRTNNGGYDNLERLDHLRRVMFPRSTSFGQRTIPLEHQGRVGTKYVENTRWTQGGVVFVGLNVPGSNNNLVHDDAECTNRSARTPAQCAAGNAEYAERDAKNIEWMSQSFQLAKTRRAPGIMIVIQADPGFDLPETEDIDERTLPRSDGYTAFLNKLVEETRAFPGQVVLVHGDTHFFKIDKPLIKQSEMIPNFTRLETFGSPNIHWVSVTVNPSSRDVFTFQPRLVAGN